MCMKHVARYRNSVTLIGLVFYFVHFFVCVLHPLGVVLPETRRRFFTFHIDEMCVCVCDFVPLACACLNPSSSFWVSGYGFRGRPIIFRSRD